MCWNTCKQTSKDVLLQQSRLLRTNCLSKAEMEVVVHTGRRGWGRRVHNIKRGRHYNFKQCAAMVPHRKTLTAYERARVRATIDSSPLGRLRGSLRLKPPAADLWAAHCAPAGPLDSRADLVAAMFGVEVNTDYINTCTWYFRYRYDTGTILVPNLRIRSRICMHERCCKN